MNVRRIRRGIRLLTTLAMGTVIVSSCAIPPWQEELSPVRTGLPDTSGEVMVTGAQSGMLPSATARPGRTLLRMPPGARGPADDVLASVGSGEELWVIATPAPQAAQQHELPGTGALLARLEDEANEQPLGAAKIPLPLQHTEVRASIDGYISTVHVTQKFENPFDGKIEAVYLFPLPEKAAVSEFLMLIGERRIRGILREKAEAEAIYNEARSQGYRASLLVQHRPNVFEQKVANIEPGKSIDVDIKYFHTLSYHDGWYSFVFPAVVGPRYNPPGQEDGQRRSIFSMVRDSVLPGDRTAVRYLRPHERSAHDLRIDVAVDAGVAIEELRSSHEIVSSRETPETATVQLAGQATIPNRDFILSFRVAGDTIKSNLLTYEDPETQQGYFTLMIYPPATAGSLERRPMEMIFVLDCSGSMSGRPLKQAKSAISSALKRLQEGDTFQIIRFSDSSSQFGETPVPATRQNLEQAQRYLESLNGSGGTEMIEGIKAALDFPHDPERLRFVSFMTDGYIGNEAEVLGEVHRRIGNSRIFSFGVGSSVNRFLLERMAKEGRGAVAYLGPQDSAKAIMDGFFDRISHPALADVYIDFGGMAVSDVYPAKLPDLFVGRPVLVTGKYLGAASGITVSGKAGEVEHSFDVAADLENAKYASIPKIWARLRIAELVDRRAFEADPYGELGTAIRDTALEHQLMSDFTSFIAVDSTYRTEGTSGTTVHQAVPVPDGVRYETTVESRE